MMTGIYSFFQYIVANFGSTSGLLFMILVILIAFVVLIIRTFPDIIKGYMENGARNHKKNADKRMDANLQITQLLSDAVTSLNLTRAMVLEYSNGHSNIAGFPFLYFNATYEQMKIGQTSICQDFQQVNVSLFADFASKLKSENYIYIENLEDIKDKYPVLYGILKKYNACKTLFYSFYGLETPMGALVFEGDTSATKDELVKYAADISQKINLLLNNDDSRQGK